MEVYDTRQEAQRKSSTIPYNYNTVEDTLNHDYFILYLLIYCYISLLGRSATLLINQLVYTCKSAIVTIHQSVS